VRKEDEVMLGTAPELSELIQTLTKEELSKDLGKAGLETLSIILYFGPITRSEIDYIRGVNSTFVLRTLLIRGLIERVQNKADQRSFLYKPTFELLSHLGIKDIQHLPEYKVARNELEAFRKAQSERDESEKTLEQAQSAPQSTPLVS
ncbi:MAG TPA: SMC-Scp complex subunit ScpB, partial [Candidatus Paceibacterota bacterium]